MSDDTADSLEVSYSTVTEVKCGKNIALVIITLLTRSSRLTAWQPR